MNTNDVLQLIQTLTETGYKHIDVTHEGSHILLSNADIQASLAGSGLMPQVGVQPLAPNLTPISEVNPLSTPVATSSLSNSETRQEVEASKDEKQQVLGGTLVKSPIVGTFYAAASPDTDDYVSIGSKVKKGDVLCIIEAMKLMNEIEAECDGEIAEILVNNEDGVEYDQALFRIV